MSLGSHWMAALFRILRINPRGHLGVEFGFKQRPEEAWGRILEFQVSSGEGRTILEHL